MKSKIAFLSFVLILTSFISQSAIVYVDSANTSTTHNGESWGTAFVDFQDGVDAANTGDSVWVARGTYIPPSGSSFTMKEGVKIFGGFINTHTAFWQRDFKVNVTILKGNDAGVIVNDTNYLTIDAVIDGFTIRDGYLSGNYGAGMKNFQSSPVIANCVFYNNIAYGSYSTVGGGMYNGYCDPIIINCIFEKNRSTDGDGGGMYNLNANPSIINCVFSRNAVDFFGAGGGMYNEDSSPQLTNCTFVGNRCGTITSGGAGAAIYSIWSSPNLVNCIVWGNYNSSGGSGLYGGAGGLYHCLTQGFAVGDPSLHNIHGDTDPLFVDTASANYQLQEASPCINAGNNDTIPDGIVTDLLGNNRIYNDTADMGAYEFYEPFVSLGGDTTICAGDSVYLNALNAGSTYEWNTGATSQGIWVYTGGTYYVTVTNAGGVSIDSIDVALSPVPTLNLGNDTTIEYDASIMLDAGNPGAAYLWNTGATTQTISVTAAGTYYVTVTNSSGCLASDTIVINMGSLGIDTRQRIGHGLTVSPNPAKETIQINVIDDKLLNTGAVLCDIYGRIVLKILIKEKSEQIPISALLPGVYILKAVTGNNLKIVKE